MRSPYFTYSLATCLLIASFVLALFVFSPEPPLSLYAFLISINLSAWILIAWDKAIAGRTITRVPERVFLALALLGGAAGLLLGMKLFRHKTKKGSFQYSLVAIFAIQALLILIVKRYLAL